MIAGAAAAWAAFAWIVLLREGSPLTVDAVLSLTASALTLPMAGLLIASPPAATGCLLWNGRDWRWVASTEPLPGQEVHVRVALDLGAWLLLSVRTAAPRGPQRWLPVGRAQAASAWHGLRCALFHPSDAASPHEPLPAATTGAALP